MSDGRTDAASEVVSDSTTKPPLSKEDKLKADLDYAMKSFLLGEPAAYIVVFASEDDTVHRYGHGNVLAQNMLLDLAKLTLVGGVPGEKK